MNIFLDPVKYLFLASSIAILLILLYKKKFLAGFVKSIGLLIIFFGIYENLDPVQKNLNQQNLLLVDISQSISSNLLTNTSSKIVDPNIKTIYFSDSIIEEDSNFNLRDRKSVV